MTPMDDRLIEALRNTHLAYLADIRAMIHELISLPAPAEEKVADIVGEVRALEVRLGEWRRGLLVETPEGEGVNYRVTTGHKATRSYNTAAILYAIDGDPARALRTLRAADVVRLQWRWSQLQRFFASTGRDLVVTNHEITDSGEIDGPMVGQVWEDVTRLEGKEGT